MPTSHCNYPHHHGPSAGPPLGLLAAIGLGAVVIACWHTVVVALVVIAILAAIAGGVMLLVHAAHTEPYDAPGREDASTVGQQLLAHRVGELEHAHTRTRVDQLEREAMRQRVDALENQAAVRAEVEQAVVKLAIAQQQRQLDAITAAPVVGERDAIMAEPWFPNQEMRP